MRRKCLAVFLVVTVLATVSHTCLAAQADSPAILGQPPRAVVRDFDEQDTLQRVLLLTPRGPLVVEASLTVDGQPYRKSWKRLVEQMLAAADTDADGQATWTEALGNPRFAFGLLGYQGRNADQIKQRTAQFDKNKDHIVDGAEARLMLTTMTGGGVFMVYSQQNYAMWNTQGYANAGARRQVFAIMDSDASGDLSPDELAVAASRLKSRDVDDDDLLNIYELGSQASTPTYGVRRSAGARGASYRPIAAQLGPTADFPTIKRALNTYYATEAWEPYSIDRQSFAALDTDGNGNLDAPELPGLNHVRPHLRIRVQLGGKENSATSVSLVEVGDPLKPAVKEIVDHERDLLLDLGEVTLRFGTRSTRPQSDYLPTAKAQIARYDTDGNLYLEKDEVVTKQPRLAAQFAMWDQDGDGRVFAEEIRDMYQARQRPQNSRIIAMAYAQPDKVFSLLDVSGDGKLNRREMAGAAQRLKQMDSNRDGRVADNELPLAISLTFGRGYAAYNARFAGNQTPPAANSNSTPPWFRAMDSNADGDLTPREFLGTAEQFAQLDTNKDGFIEVKEAANSVPAVPAPAAGR